MTLASIAARNNPSTRPTETQVRVSTPLALPDKASASLTDSGPIHEMQCVFPGAHPGGPADGHHAHGSDRIGKLRHTVHLPTGEDASQESPAVCIAGARRVDDLHGIGGDGVAPRGAVHKRTGLPQLDGHGP